MSLKKQLNVRDQSAGKNKRKRAAKRSKRHEMKLEPLAKQSPVTSEKHVLVLSRDV